MIILPKWRWIVAEIVSIIITDTPVNTCFSICLKKTSLLFQSVNWKTSEIKLLTWDLPLRLNSGEWYLLTTWKLANQRTRKALFTCVGKTKMNYVHDYSFIRCFKWESQLFKTLWALVAFHCRTFSSPLFRWQLMWNVSKILIFEINNERCRLQLLLAKRNRYFEPNSEN